MTDRKIALSEGGSGAPREDFAESEDHTHGTAQAAADIIEGEFWPKFRAKLENMGGEKTPIDYNGKLKTAHRFRMTQREQVLEYLHTLNEQLPKNGDSIILIEDIENSTFLVRYGTSKNTLPPESVTMHGGATYFTRGVERPTVEVHTQKKAA